MRKTVRKLHRLLQKASHNRAPRTRTSSRSTTVLCFVSKGQAGTLMMCLLSVSAAICLKLPHYADDQIKCTPGPHALLLRYCLCQVTGDQRRHVRAVRAGGRPMLHVCQRSHDMILITLKPSLSGRLISWWGSQTGEAAGVFTNRLFLSHIFILWLLTHYERSFLNYCPFYFEQIFVFFVIFWL